MRSSAFPFVCPKIILIWSFSILTAFDRAASMTFTIWAGQLSTLYVNREVQLQYWYIHSPHINQTVTIPDNVSIIAVQVTSHDLNPGLMASTANSNYILSNSSWKCINQEALFETDISWTSFNFNDGGWANASLYGRNGDYIDVFQPDAYWIWTYHKESKTRTDADTAVYCRLRIVTGRLLTYLASIPTVVYIDGREQQVHGMETGDWQKGYSIQVPNDLQVIGFKSNTTPSSRYYGIGASTSDEYIVTNSSWKCTNQTPDTSWTDACYDDSSWQNAYIHSSISYWALPGFSLQSYQIWTERLADRLVYCRLSLKRDRSACSNTSSVTTVRTAGTAETTSSANLNIPDDKNLLTTRAASSLDRVDQPNTSSSIDMRGALIGGFVGEFCAVLIVIALVVFIIYFVKKRRKHGGQEKGVVRAVNVYGESPSSAQIPTKDFQDLKRPKAENSIDRKGAEIYDTMKKNNRLTLDSLQTYDYLRVLRAENDYHVRCNSTIGESNDQHNNSANPTDAAVNLDRDTT